MKKAFLSILTLVVFSLINIVFYSSLEPAQQEQVMAFEFTKKTIPFFLVFFITAPLGLFLSIGLAVIKLDDKSEQESDITNTESDSINDIPVSQLKQMVAIPFNNQQYQQAIDAFDEISNALSDDKDKLSEFHSIWAMKIIALAQIDGDDDAEMAALESRWGDDYTVMFPNCYMFMMMEYYEYILTLTTQTRQVLSAKLQTILKLGLLDMWQEVKDAYDVIEPHELEKEIVITIDNETKAYTIDDIRDFTLNNDLPNNNVYVNFSVERDGVLISASIPGKDNDGICAEGFVTVDNDKQSFEIARHHVKENPLFNLSGIVVSTDNVHINIKNVKLLDEMIAQRNA